MKKSLLNIAVTMALSSAVFSGSVLSTQAYADEPVLDDNSIDNTSETYMYPGMGVGAASGALIAGPVGLLFRKRNRAHGGLARQAARTGGKGVGRGGMRPCDHRG